MLLDSVVLAKKEVGLRILCVCPYQQLQGID